jgi:hypothetical protein
MASRFSVVGSFQYFLIVVPEIQETFVVRVAIRSTSEHDRDAATPSGSPQARPALHHVKRVISESQFLDTLFHNVGEVLKGVNEILMARHTALAEAGIVGRHHVKGCGKPAGSDSGTCWTKSEIHARADGRITHRMLLGTNGSSARKDLIGPPVFELPVPKDFCSVRRCFAHRGDF